MWTRMAPSMKEFVADKLDFDQFKTNVQSWQRHVKCDICDGHNMKRDTHTCARTCARVCGCMCARVCVYERPRARACACACLRACMCTSTLRDLLRQVSVRRVGLRCSTTRSLEFSIKAIEHVSGSSQHLRNRHLYAGCVGKLKCRFSLLVVLAMMQDKRQTCATTSSLEWTTRKSQRLKSSSFRLELSNLHVWNVVSVRGQKGAEVSILMDEPRFFFLEVHNNQEGPSRCTLHKRNGHFLPLSVRFV